MAILHQMCKIKEKGMSRKELKLHNLIQLCNSKLIIVALLFISFAMGYSIPHEELVAYGLSQIGVAGTGSMKPFIYKEDTLIVEKINENYSLNLGSIYIFRNWNSNSTIVHRLVSQVNSTHYIFKGDANRIADPPIERS